MPSPQTADPVLLDEVFYDRSSLVVAPDLLNKVLVVGDLAGRIVEVEAYCGATDPASHAYRGRTPRTDVMFGPGGHLYVYFTYGMHWCANAVTGAENEAGAVLIRAVEPLRGLATMQRRRPKATRERDLTNGPAKLTQALGIDGDHNGTQLTDPIAPVSIFDDGTPAPTAPVVSPRIGISVAQDFPWRWHVPDNQWVSRRAS